MKFVTKCSAFLAIAACNKGGGDTLPTLKCPTNYTINAAGEWCGVLFDGNYESMATDWMLGSCSMTWRSRWAATPVPRSSKVTLQPV